MAYPHGPRQGGKWPLWTQVVDQRQSPPLWPNSPQRCKHYMGEWPTDRPQRLQSEGQWFVQQPIRWVCVCDRVSVCVRACVRAVGGRRRGHRGAKLNHPVSKKDLKVTVTKDKLDLFTAAYLWLRHTDVQPHSNTHTRRASGVAASIYLLNLTSQTSVCVCVSVTVFMLLVLSLWKRMCTFKLLSNQQQH